MGRLVPALIVLAALPGGIPAAVPAFAKAKPAAHAAKTAPTPAPAKAFYAAMTDGERAAIESDLAWTGDYNGMVGAEFADRAIEAVKAYQKRNGGKDTGILNPDERGKLAQAARARQEQAGWRLIDDPATGARVGVPLKLVSAAGKGRSGTRWQSVHGEVQIETFANADTTLAAVFDREKREPAGRKPDYNVLRPDFFVVSGLQGLKKFYVRGQGRDKDVRGLTVLYDQAMEGTMDRIAVAMSSAFVGFPGQVAGPAPRRKVEYGTGVVVSPFGDIVTGGDLLAGCSTIVVPGLGNAERIAQEDGAALALVRVHGARDLAPIALGGSGPDGDVTLVGITDPQAQDGGHAVSTARARVASGNAVEPVPAAGFDGAAAIGRDGKLAGMVGLRSSGAAGAAGAGAVVVPAGTIANFLAAQKIAPAAGPGGIEAAKLGVVRVICVRK
jgi:hypothetical protein